jgi:hypothetical protein
MTIWEKSVVNIQKGILKVTVAAATFSERVKAEIAVVRLRIRLDEVQARIDGLHKIIGRKVETLKNSEMMPKTTDQLLKDENIDVALRELGEWKKELEDLKSEIKREQDAFKSVMKQTEDTAV